MFSRHSCTVSRQQVHPQLKPRGLSSLSINITHHPSYTVFDRRWPSFFQVAAAHSLSRVWNELPRHVTSTSPQRVF